MVLVTLCKSADRGRRCQALIRLLKQPNRIPDYEKNKDYFDVLKPLQATAIQRAKVRTEQIQNQGIERFHGRATL